MGVAGAFLSVFVLRLGAGNVLVGLLTSLPALITILGLIPAGGLIERQPDRLRLLQVSSFLLRLSYLLVALVPLFLTAYQAEAVVAIVVLGTIPTAIAGVTFSAVIADLVPAERRAHVISRRKFLFSIVTTVSALAGGWFLEWAPFPANFQILFGAGFLSSLVSLYYQTRFGVPQRPAAPSSASAREPRLQRIRGYLSMLAGQRRFRGLALSSVAYHWGHFMTVPLYPIYWVRVLEAGNAWVGAFGMLTSGAMALTYPLWGRAAARRGTRPVFVASAMAGVFYPALTALSPSVEPMLFVAVVGGVVSAGFSLCHFNRVLEMTPEDHRPSFLAAYNALINIPVFVAPMVGTALADSIGIANALLLGSLFRFLGALAYARWG